MPYELHKGDLFANAPENSILVHACNAQGRWGRGIALEFKKRYYQGYLEHQGLCTGQPSDRGTAHIVQNKVGCLITSLHYKPHDSVNNIVRNTGKAVRVLLKDVMENYSGHEIHSCRINVGLFHVPWELSEKQIKNALEETGDKVKWVVWEWP